MNRHHITFFNAQLEQGIGEAADVAVQLFIADMFALAAVVAFPDDGGTIAVFLQMAVKAVCRQIQRPSSYHLMDTLPGAKEVFFTFW
ncbi:hypothetical protein [Shigella boydii]|uniref:hypothetical protein n=1 Tax=Shigella boydii TaxID=621 RepID=UPI003F4957FF